MSDGPDRAPVGTLFGAGDVDEQLAYVVETMRSMSRQTDPQQMVREYGERVRRILDIDCSVSLSRRDVDRPRVVVTRSSLSDVSGANPWTERGRLPVLCGGLLADLIWGDVPVVVNDLTVPETDPAHPYLRGMRSLAAIPLYDQGQSLNMVVLARSVPGGFDRRHFPEHVWMSNLFGRATFNLVLSQDLRRAYDTIDRDLAKVAALQQSLLPPSVPTVATLDLAAHYQTSRRAGGDYYDFIELPGGRWGLLSADVSGHSTPAAVIMAVVHSIVGLAPTAADEPPGKLLSYVNRRLTARYTGDSGTFVTAFYGIYDPADRTLTYSTAGHPPPLLHRPGTADVQLLAAAGGLPLGIDADERYPAATVQLSPGDRLLIYTDGLTEARGPDGAFLETAGLSDALASATGSAADVLASVLAAVDAFTGSAAPTDDRTAVVAVAG